MNGWNEEKEKIKVKIKIRRKEYKIIDWYKNVRTRINCK